MAKWAESKETQYVLCRTVKSSYNLEAILTLVVSDQRPESRSCQLSAG